MAILFLLIFNLLTTAAFLWLGMKLMQVFTGEGWEGEYCAFRYLALAALGAALASIVPMIGFVLSWLVLILLLIKFTETSLKEVLIMVLFAKVMSWVAYMFFSAAF